MQEMLDCWQRQSFDRFIAFADDPGRAREWSAFRRELVSV
jgi:hypothetical protein